MNRHARRTLAKLDRTPAVAPRALQDVLEDMKSKMNSIQGLAELPEMFTEVQDLVKTMVTDVQTLENEMRIRDLVLPKVLAELTQNRVEDVIAIEARFLVEARKEVTNV